MAVTPLGNSTFVSQNAALPSTQASNELAKENFAALANLSEFQSKDKSVERIDRATPADELQEEVKDKRDEETKKQEQEAKKQGGRRESSGENSESSEDGASLHRLDISI